MDLYSKPIADVTYADIQAFLDAKHPESRILDYKGAWTEHPVRVMAAFANTDGGIMLVGVDEEDKTGRPLTPPTGVDMGEGEDAIKRQVESAAYDGVYPPLFPEVQVCRKTDDPDRAVVLVRVAESHETPHWTDDRQRVYVRVQSQNRFGERQAHPEELEWLLHRRAAAVEVREGLIVRARERVAQITSVPGEPPSDQAIVETYAVPVYPDQPRVDLAELHKFGRTTAVRSTVQMTAYNEFPVSSWSSRPVAGGVAVTANRDGRLQQCIQIDELGLLHSQVYVGDTRDEQPRFFASWIAAPIDGFLRYLMKLSTAFGPLRSKPMLLRAAVSLPANARILWLSDAFEVKPLLDTRIELLRETCLPSDLEATVDGLTRECVRRILWAGGYAWASDEQGMDRAMSYLLTGRR